MHDEHVALLAACQADPGDLLPRLILADWLDDHGVDGSAWRGGEAPPPDWLPESGDYGSGGGDDQDYAGGSCSIGDGGNGSASGDYGSGGIGDAVAGDGDGNAGSYRGDGDGHGGRGGSGGRGRSPVRLRPTHTTRRRLMPAIGDHVLVLTEGNYSPYAWVGRVVSMNGPRDWVLDEAAMIPHCGSGCTWAGLAQDKGDMRSRMRVRMEGAPIEVYGVQCCRQWVGDLPTADQD